MLAVFYKFLYIYIYIYSLEIYKNDWDHWFNLLSKEPNCNTE